MMLLQFPEDRLVENCKLKPEAFVGQERTTLLPAGTIPRNRGTEDDADNKILNIVPFSLVPPETVVPYSVLPDKTSPPGSAPSTSLLKLCRTIKAMPSVFI